MARLKNHDFRVGDILRLSACGLRTLKIPVRGPENKFVTVIEVESFTYSNGETQYYYRVRDNATGCIYDQSVLKMTKGLSGFCFTGKIYSRI